MEISLAKISDASTAQSSLAETSGNLEGRKVEALNTTSNDESSKSSRTLKIIRIIVLAYVWLLFTFNLTPFIAPFIPLRSLIESLLIKEASNQELIFVVIGIVPTIIGAFKLINAQENTTPSKNNPALQSPSTQIPQEIPTKPITQLETPNKNNAPSTQESPERIEENPKVDIPQKTPVVIKPPTPFEASPAEFLYQDTKNRSEYRKQLENNDISLQKFIEQHGWENIVHWGIQSATNEDSLCSIELLRKKFFEFTNKNFNQGINCIVHHIEYNIIKINGHFDINKESVYFLHQGLIEEFLKKQILTQEDKNILAQKIKSSFHTMHGVELLVNWKWIKQFDLLDQDFLQKNQKLCNWLDQNEQLFYSLYSQYKNNQSGQYESFKEKLYQLDNSYNQMKRTK